MIDYILAAAIIQLIIERTCVCTAAYTHKTITRSVNNNARASEKYAVQFQLMFVQLLIGL